jgi:hypothetical protein
MEDLGAVLEARSFDGVLSNFGAINCVQNLPRLIADLAGRLEPGSRLVWVVMGRLVPWEWAWYLARGEWRKAWRRLQRDGVSWRGLTITYPTPSEAAALLWPYFKVERMAPLGVVLPPSYAAEWLERSPRSLEVLTRMEHFAHHFGALARCSDHYILEAVRSG